MPTSLGCRRLTCNLGVSTTLTHRLTTTFESCKYLQGHTIQRASPALMEPTFQPGGKGKCTVREQAIACERARGQPAARSTDQLAFAGRPGLQSTASQESDTNE